MDFPFSGFFRPRSGMTRRRILATGLGGVLAPALAACSGGAALDSFDLTAVSAGRGVAIARGQLVVSEPIASPPTDSDRIIVRPTPDTLATLKGAQWVDRLPRLVQTRLVQTFENSRLLKSVGRPEAKLQADYTLSSEIRNFEMDVAGGAAVVEISVKLVAEKNGRIVAAQVFSNRIPGSADQGANAAFALDQALGQTMQQIVAWTASRI